MKRTSLLILLALAFTFTAFSQSPTKIAQRCKSPNGSIYGNVNLNANGDITQTPCPARSNFFNGITDFSNATVTGLSGAGNVSNVASTANFFPNWVNGSHLLINTPYSWDGTTYTWQNTAANSTFPFTFSPVSAAGAFTAGQTNVSKLVLTQSTGDASVTGNSTIHINSRGGITTVGDTGGAGNSTLVTVSDSGNLITLAATNVQTSGGLKPVVAGTGTVGSATLPFSSVYVGSTAAHNTQITGTFQLDTSPAPVSSSLAANFTKANATFGNTALSVTLVAGKTYAFQTNLYCSNSTAGEGVKVDFAGGAATATTFIAGENDPTINLTSTTLAGVFNAATLTGTQVLSIKGTIIVNAGGTFIVRAAENSTSTGTLTCLTGSSLITQRLN